VVGKLVQKWEGDSYIQKETQYSQQEIKQRILNNISKLLQGYLPIKLEETNGRNARQNTAQCIVLAVLDG
jgi:hypothetical protein